ncbi:MAG: hypothetical protein ABJN65_04210 [Parasphingorhabdus sp.]
MNKQIIAAIAVIPLVLSACSKSEDDGSSFSIDLSDESAEETEKIIIGGEGKDSKFSIKADGFSMDVDLPEITLDSDDFDLNNVALYPGSKITNFNIEDQKGEGGKVTVSFVAPTSVDELSEWFQTKMTEEEFEVAKQGNNLSGTTDEGDSFLLELNETSSEETSGKLQFSEVK